MDILNIFDKELGAKVRGVIVVCIAIATLAIYVLQAALDAAHFLPDWDEVGAIGVQIQGIIVLLARFTSFGDKVVGPHLDDDDGDDA